jgi:hypothetical protein
MVMMNLILQSNIRNKCSDVVSKLIEEYKAAERTDYLEWGQEGAKGEQMQIT